MELGIFSISLSVKDIQASRAFYEALGFSTVLGDEEQGWLIMKNGVANVGLFQGMFDRNTLTFNPGWDNNGNELEMFTDIREIQSALDAAGITFEERAEVGTGPANLAIVDPDGNPVIIDQHVDSPKGKD